MSRRKLIEQAFTEGVRWAAKDFCESLRRALPVAAAGIKADGVPEDQLVQVRVLASVALLACVDDLAQRFGADLRALPPLDLRKFGENGPDIYRRWRESFDEEKERSKNV